ncbi:MAG: M1 family aminopeptidase [Bacteroidia bacterium]
MKFSLPLAILLLSSPFAFSQVFDSVDVQHYHIAMQFPQLSAKTFTARCNISFKTNQNLDEVNLHLSSLTVDSIFLGQQKITFSHTGDNLQVLLPASMNPGDTATIAVYYQGTPAQDPSRWGGFYFNTIQDGYAWNLGVGFEVDPHNFGRAWFPCRDNFEDKATYTFAILTDSNLKAFCNGSLENVTNHGNGTSTWNWNLRDSIPTYLASVAIANYHEVYFPYTGIASTFPVSVAAHPEDTGKARKSFENLPRGLLAFENAYGPQPFERVGFCVVPFTGGAMEHATNIAYPRFATDGTLAYESLWAHELSHHWWGDHVTCATAEDMWLNEGWASWSEALFFEHLNGAEAYREYVRANHLQVLRYAHTDLGDEQPLPVSPVGHEHTYGTHVYNKGADMVHTLRNYIGDAKFFPALKLYQDSFAFKNASSADLRDFLSRHTGVDLQHFFNDWIFQAGFAHFSIEKWSSSQSSTGYDITVNLRQKLRFADHNFTNVPLELVFMSSDWKMHVETIMLSGNGIETQVNIPFEPVFAGVNIDGKLSDAKTRQHKIIAEKGVYEFSDALMEIDVESITDSAFLLVEHNWVAADPFKGQNPGIRISDYRYYSVSGVWPIQFEATATIPYEGRTIAGGYLDHTLDISTEDSLVLLYRSSPSQNWTEYPDYEKEMILKTDKRGKIIINDLKQGEYVIGYRDIAASVEEPKGRGQLQLFPNPAEGWVRIKSPVSGMATLTIFDMSGKQVDRQHLQLGDTTTLVQLQDYRKGTYLFEVRQYDWTAQQKVVVR